MNLLGYKIKLELPSLDNSTILIINTINPHSYCVAKKDKDFSLALTSSDYLIPDGVGIVLASYFLNNQKIQKISGFDLHIHFLNLLQSRGGGRVFYLGASEGTLSLIKKRLKEDFPTLEVKTYSPPFKNKFTEEENQDMILDINRFDPDVLFVGMTAPKQEKWVYQHKSQLKAKVVCSIGAVFDFYAGTVKRPSQFWIDLGLEWFPRFIKEPKRLWRRNLISTPQFIFEVLRAKLGQ
ncbi:WecB/TagA/CpsF family glycosyltransferase [Algoriphagus sp. NBT04N3]|uniref:WecB/TagA/CpsF family glycosyltransferase n=1 Tax=Algoriphagus sp. NBT04N3 TaxID=2705473 RepID=UPI001C630FCF|nr:WecB/TagA/CpsF family glycosyltransferase [Algoriphagus sp. NBT04N3]QYH38976.1 WecB/TagA/CpsF family glycosyltransferase [Algoriphagus sp. NBT04N3]